MKVFAAFLLVLLVALQYRLWLSDDGVRQLVTLRRAVAAQKKENEDLLRRNSELAGEVKDLKGGYSAVEEHARYDQARFRVLHREAHHGDVVEVIADFAHHLARPQVAIVAIPAE